MLTILRRRGLGNTSCLSIQRFIDENHGRTIAITRSDRIGSDDYEAVLRWGCTSTFHNAPICINTPEMIHAVNDKPGCRKKLVMGDVRVPTSFYRKEDIAIANFPVIGRPSRHSQGRHITVSNNHEELRRDTKSEYWSEIVSKDREYRVYTFFGRILMVAEKVPTEVGRRRLAWNHAGGGSVFKNVTWSNWPIESCKLALKASNVMGIDFSGVDVMEKEGVPYIIELNSAHSLTSEYRQKTFAKGLNWAIEEIERTNEKPAHFEYPEHIRTYKSLILPCLRS